jgi:hypothetical protein
VQVAIERSVISIGQLPMMRTFYGDSHVVKEWMESKFCKVEQPTDFHSTICLVDERTNRIKGAVWLESYNGVSVILHVAGENRYWATRKLHFQRARLQKDYRHGKG